MKPIRSLLLPLLCLLLALGAVSCGTNETTPQKVLEALLEMAEDAPSGVTYRSDAAEGSGSYASPQLLTTLYGEDAEERFAAVEAYAVYLSSFAAPCELAVFRCYSASDANRIEELCLRRAEELRVALRNTPYEARSHEICVLLKGKWVFFLLCENPENMQKEALRAVG